MSIMLISVLYDDGFCEVSVCVRMSYSLNSLKGVCSGLDGAVLYGLLRGILGV